MPTEARMSRYQGRYLPVHRHPLTTSFSVGRLSRFHFPWERHRHDINAHNRESAQNPTILDVTGVTFNGWEYIRALTGVNLLRHETIHVSPSSERIAVATIQRAYGRERRHINAENAALQAAVADVAVARERAEESANPISMLARRFGVEIECIADSSDLRAALQERGIPSRSEEWNHQVRRYWKITTDGSVQYHGRRDISPMEVVSPILSNEIDDLGNTALSKVCDALKHVHALINRTCGLHIHHDAADFDKNKAHSLLQTYYYAQGAIDKIVSKSRRSSVHASYCQAITTSDMAMVHVGNRGSLRDLALNMERYKVVNINAFYKYGTIEFRQHQGTIEYDKIHAWLELGKHFMDAAVKEKTLTQATENLDELFEFLEFPDELSRYYHERSKELMAAPEEAPMREEGTPGRRGIVRVDPQDLTEEELDNSSSSFTVSVPVLSIDPNNMEYEELVSTDSGRTWGEAAQAAADSMTRLRQALREGPSFFTTTYVSPPGANRMTQIDEEIEALPVWAREFGRSLRPLYEYELF